jgi:hypothetical protein
MLIDEIYPFNSLSISEMSISSLTSSIAFLNCLIPLPNPFANSGNLFDPKSNKITSIIISNSGVPTDPNIVTHLLIGRSDNAI